MRWWNSHTQHTCTCVLYIYVITIFIEQLRLLKFKFHLFHCLNGKINSDLNKERKKEKNRQTDTFSNASEFQKNKDQNGQRRKQQDLFLMQHNNKILLSTKSEIYKPSIS